MMMRGFWPTYNALDKRVGTGLISRFPFKILAAVSFVPSALSQLLSHPWAGIV